MHTFVAHKWACLVLLWGLSTSLARPFEDDNLFAFAPSDGNTFTDTLPIDGGSETLLFDDFPQDFGDLNLGTGPLLGYDPSIGSGFDIAATGDCSPYGEAYQDAGAVAFSSEGCPADHSNKGCGRLGSTTVILCNTSCEDIILLKKYHSLLLAVESRLPDYCAPANQKCCAGVSAVAVSRNDFSSMCLRVNQTLSIGGWVGY